MARTLAIPALGAAVLLTGSLLAGAARADDDCLVPMTDWQPRSAVADLAAARGWQVRRIRVDDGCYQILGRDAAGRSIEVTPVIILTALDQVSDRIEGLNAGADDYMVKPFDLAELSARIGSVARRYAGNPNPIIRHGDLDIDLAARSVHRAGRPVELTAREWALFETLLARPGQLFPKAQLEEKLYAFGAEVESNTIEVHVSRLRKKLGAGVVETERGLGYRLGRG